MVIVADDENRENEADLIMAASRASVEAIALMIRHCSGIICVPAAPSVLDSLDLGPMVTTNADHFRTAFTVSVDAARGVTTGISASDRVRTIHAIASPGRKPADLVRPGHVFPLRARPGGVLERPGHTEAAVDLVSMAGLEPVGVLCELMNDDGTVMRLPEVIDFKRAHGLVMISVAALVAHREKTCCGSPVPGSPLNVP